MIVADVLKIFLLVVGALLMAVAYQLAAVGLFPRAVDRWSERLRRSPLLSLVVGGLTAAPFVMLSIGSFSSGAPLGGLMILGPPALVGLVGLAGVGREIGRGLPTMDEEASWRQVLRGGGVLVLLLLLPFFGWFVLLPAALALGLGLVVSDFASHLARRRGTAVWTPPAEKPS